MAALFGWLFEHSAVSSLFITVVSICHLLYFNTLKTIKPFAEEDQCEFSGQEMRLATPLNSVPGQRVHDLLLGRLLGHREGLPEGHDHHGVPVLVGPVVRQVNVVQQLDAPRTPANFVC